MRGLDTPVKKIRKKVFTEIAKVGFNSTDETLIADIEAIPYSIVQEKATYRESIYRERAVASERVRLAMGMSLRPENKAVHITSGIEASNIDEKYYEPPLMQVIPSACDACEPNKYEVSNMCRGCVAHPCAQVCPKGAISIIDGRSVIDQEKCIRCGKCKAVCPYDAISHKERPCAKACGVNAIESDSQGRAVINNQKCVSCGMCMVNCPFGAISDKSQIFQLAHALKEGTEIIAEVAPAFVGQFGPKVTPGKLRSAMKALGFTDVIEVAVGADLCATDEAKDFMENVPDKLPFMATSCCPAWSVMAKKLFPEFKDCVSMTLTPMVLTGRLIKLKDPEAKVVFIGPCAAKKLEASRKSVRSDIDFVLTFEEMMGVFEAKNIDLEAMEEEKEVSEASRDGRNFAIAGGVAEAVVNCIKKMYPDQEIKVESAQGLRECKKLMTLAKAGKYNGYLLEGRACPGGCVAGAGTLQAINKSTMAVKQYATSADYQYCCDTDYLKDLEELGK